MLKGQVARTSTRKRRGTPRRTAIWLPSAHDWTDDVHVQIYQEWAAANPPVLHSCGTRMMPLIVLLFSQLQAPAGLHALLASFIQTSACRWCTGSMWLSNHNKPVCCISQPSRLLLAARHGTPPGAAGAHGAAPSRSAAAPAPLSCLAPAPPLPELGARRAG